MSAINIGRLAEEKVPSTETVITVTPSDCDVEMVVVETFLEAPMFPAPNSVRMKRCQQHIAHGALGMMHHDFLFTTEIPDVDDDPIIRARIECPGVSPLFPSICQVAMAQYDRYGDEIRRVSPQYETNINHGV